MNKVILITSREFQTFESFARFKELSSYQDITINPSNRADEVDDNDKGKYLGVFFEDPWKLDLSILTDKKTVKNKTEAVRDGIQEKKIPRRKGLGSFTFGIWRKQLSGTEYIYCADEFPPMERADKAAKFKYLNALVDEIKNDLGNNPIEWTILSHDRDWDVDKSSEIIKKKGCLQPSGIEGYGNYLSLKKILEDENTFIAVFQHDSLTSEWYKHVKQVFNSQICESQKKGEEQKQAVCNLLSKKSVSPADFVNLKINPEHPYIDLDKAISFDKHSS